MSKKLEYITKEAYKLPTNMKSDLTSLVRVRKIKTTIILHLPKWLKLKRPTILNIREYMEQQQLILCCRNVIPLWKILWHYLQKKRSYIHPLSEVCVIYNI